MSPMSRPRSRLTPWYDCIRLDTAVRIDTHFLAAFDLSVSQPCVEMLELLCVFLFVRFVNSGVAVSDDVHAE